MDFVREIVEFIDGYDHWELMDSYGGIEEAILVIKSDLKDKRYRLDVANWFKSVATESENDFVDRIMAAKIYRRLVTLNK